MRRLLNGQSVAVVGGAGFLGSHLVDHLINDRDCHVLVIDNLVAGRREFVNPKSTFKHHDITGSEDYLAQLFMGHDIRYVFNYAAYPYVPDSYSRPVHVFNVNAMGALKVINAADTAGCQGILQVSSAEIYGGGSGPERIQKINEDGLVTPHSSYGASKAAIDALVQVRWKESKTPCIALRQFNCIGEKETHPYVVPEIISQLTVIRSLEKSLGKAENVIVKLGNNSSRDFMYAGDAVRMAAELLEEGEFGEVYNLGSQESIKIYDLAKLIGNIMGFAGVEVVQEESRVRPWEIWHLQSDNSKINGVVTHRPGTSLGDMLRKTVDYFNTVGRVWPWEQGNKHPGLFF